MKFNSIKAIYYGLGTVLFLVTAYILYRYTLINFYIFSPATDGPLLASLVWKQGINPFAPNIGLDTYYQTHFSIIFAVFSTISYAMTCLTKVDYFSLIQCVICGLSGVISYQFLSKYYLESDKKISAYIILFVVSLFFAFNGINLNVVRFLHFENWILIFIIGFFTAFLQQRYVLGYISLVLALMTREDSGFHFAILVFTMLLYSVVFGKKLKSARHWVLLCILAFLCSAGALLIQKYFYPGDDALARVYITFSKEKLFGMDASLLFSRIKRLLLNAMVTVPLILQVIWACRSKAYHILIAAVSVMPWTLLSLVANADHAVSLATYTSFPMIVVLFWPFISFVIFETNETIKKLRKQILIWQFVIIAITTVSNFGVVKKLFYFDDNVQISDVKKFEKQINSPGIKQRLGHLIVEDAMSTMVDASVGVGPDMNSYTIVYHAKDFGLVSDTIYKHKMSNFYNIKNTNVRMASTLNLLTSVQLDNLQENKNFYIEAIVRPKNFKVTKDGVKISNIKKSRVFDLSPMHMDKGHYCINISVDSFKPEQVMDFYAYENQGNIILHKILRQDDFKAACQVELSLPSDNKNISMVLNPQKGQTVLLKNVDIKRIDAALPR